MIIFNLACFCSLGQKYDFLKIIPGKGIVLNNDSILLQITSIDNLCKILDIKYQSDYDDFECGLWHGYDPETGEPDGGMFCIKEITYKSLTFVYSYDYKVELVRISAKECKSMKIYTDNGFMIGEINPKIEDAYSKRNKNDYISKSKQSYSLYSYGVSFYLENLMDNELKLVEIITHLKK